MRYTSLVGLGLLLFAGMKVGAVDATKSFSASVGLQLYSLRAQFTKSPGVGTELAAKLGFRDVEVAVSPEQIPQSLSDLKQVRW